MKNESVLIISNKTEEGKQISTKLKLLRECDTVKIVSYIESISILNTTQPSLIILYCSDNDSINIIKEIRSISALDKVPIIFVLDSLDEEKLFYAFDNGIDDFFFLSDPDSIILMRIFLTLQKSILYKQIDISNEILISAKIIEPQTGIYLKEQAPVALRNFFSKSIEENLENTVFLYIRPISNNKRLNMYNIANIIKSVPRGNDIIAYGKSAGFYLILYNAGEKGAESVFTRIQHKLINQCNLFAAAAEITGAFEEMEPILYKSLKEQIDENIHFKYLKNLNINDAIEMINLKDEQGKKFVDFKKEFISGFEKIVAPVFYQVQSSNSEKFPDAEITYNINENECQFIIKENNLSSTLTISYPSYIKVIVDIKHSNNEEMPKVKRLTYNFEDFSEEKLSLILDEMINDFSTMHSISVLQDEMKNES